MSASSSLPLFNIVGFSGHRQIGPADAIARSISLELEALAAEAPGEWIALSSVASGGDQLFVREARRLGRAWHAILPLPRAEFRADFGDGEWVRVEEMLAGAGHVRVIAENGSREDAYLDCGMETVNACDVLMAVWDGEPARGKGGTADVVAYARSSRRPIVIIDAATGAVRRENFEHLRREDRALAGLNALPEHDGGWGENPFRAPPAIFAFQKKCDHAASRGAPQIRRFVVGTVMLHVAATLIAAAALAYDLESGLIPWLKLACLVGALGVALLLRAHHHSGSNWVRCRLAAEFCRSALSTWGLPRVTTLFEDLHVPEVGGIARALQILHSRSAAAQPVGMDEFRRTYLRARLDDQLAYYRRQEARALPLFGRLKAGFWAMTLLAVAATAAYAACRTLGVGVPEWVTRTVFHFLPITLPVVAAAFISLIAINDLQRRVARYREMQVVLEHSRRRIEFCQTWNSLEQLVLRTEHALLQEVMEWHSITSFTESH